jgi:hypothetical protein
MSLVSAGGWYAWPGYSSANDLVASWPTVVGLLLAFASSMILAYAAWQQRNIGQYHSPLTASFLKQTLSQHVGCSN